MTCNYYAVRDVVDRALVDSGADYIQKFRRADANRQNERSMANVNNRTYICEFTYATQNGLFSPLSRRDEFPSNSLSSVKHISGQSTRGTAALAKELAEVLLDAEANIPKEILPISWVSFRQAWLYKTKNARTIKDVAHALLDLEDGVRILIDRSQCPKDQTAWRKTVSGIHTYDLLAKYVKIFNLDVQQIIMNSVSNLHIRGIHHDQGLDQSKRKYVPETNPKKLHKIDGIHPSFQHDPCINSSQPGTRPVSVEVLPLSSSKEIVVESIYKVDQEFLPVDAPTSLKCMRAVLVAEKTRFNVTVTFPSMTSLRSYFGRAPFTNSKDHMMGTSTSLLHHQTKTETCIGTKPELDGYFNMTPKVAERVLIRPVSCTEYLHQGHLWSFWISKDLEEIEGELQYMRSSGDKDTTSDHDLEDEAKGELGAAEALTQLIPRNALIIGPDENRTIHERSSQYGSEEPSRSQVRWGIRSLRKASFGSRSGNGTSPNSCDTGTKDSRNKGRKKVSSRKILDFPDQQHQNIGQTRIIHDYIPTERSSRMHSRREEKRINLGAVKCLDTAPGKSDNSFNRSNIILKLPKDMKGRWASERYKSAQLKLIDIMHKRGAAPGKPILRPALREEARKDIGDTGLLDHLLKHMTDTVVTNGERFRRRHNAEGAMEYWLEDASLMEIRKAAGIEDPSWIPPPGWKPGEALPGRGEYGYGCFNRGMTLAEVVQMKRLKETVDKVRSDLQNLSLRVTRSRSREVTPEQNGLQDDNSDTAPENFCAIQSNVELKEVQRMKLKERGVQGEPLKQTEQGDQITAEHQKSICESREGRSTSKILTETKSQLEMDLAEVQQSISLMQEYVNCTMTELGLSQGEDIKLASKQVKSGDVGLRPISTSHLVVREAASAPLGPPTIDVDKRNCFTKASSTANINLRTCSEENDSRKSNPDFAASVDNDPKRLGLFQSNSGSDRAMEEGFRVCNPSVSGRFVRPGMIIPQTGAFGVWAENRLSPGTLPPAINTSSCLGHNTEISCEDASARVIYSIARPDEKNRFRPIFRHHTNFFSSSTDSETERKSQSALYIDHRAEVSRVKGMTVDERNFQLTGFHQATYHSEAQALAGVRREPTHASDAFSFAAGGEPSDKHSQEPVTVVGIQSLLQSRDSAITNLTFSSSASANPTREHSASVTGHPEARKRRMLHHFKTNLLLTNSITSSSLATSGDSSHSSLSTVPAAQCGRSESVKPSVRMANRPFDTTLLANPTTEHLMPTSVSKATPSDPVHMMKDPWTNLSLTSHMSPRPSNSASPPNTFSRSVSGRLAEPSSTSMFSTVLTAHGGDNFGQSQLESLHQVAGHGLEQRQVFGAKNFLEVSDRQKSFPEIVTENNYSTQSSTGKAKSSTWLGLAPPDPASSNLHS